MSKKCVHKSCGKTYTDESEACVYHPGPPVFHEGQKGWKCCKPRVLTFDEFLSIPPCTTGTHTDIDDTPIPEPKPTAPEILSNTSVSLGSLSEALPAPVARLPTTAPTASPRTGPSPAPPESEDDEEGVAIPTGASCRRRGCGQSYTGDETRANETCVHHPGAPIFHEGSKGWSCCKRRVLEFDQFMNIEGCKTKDRHLFVGKAKKDSGEEKLDTVRTDFYQTATTVIASFYLKKIDKTSSSIAFSNSTTVDLDLKTADSKRYNTAFPLYGTVDPDKCTFRILGTKLEVTLVKSDGGSWPVLRADDPLTGEIVQVGRAGRV
ncbi:chord-domain-containing protein [Melanomma pulvis-pyrius CBS 109.77]|uniref:Chord-domain-containing protein n=1 Tax=Melanomma pulvis-pyrius CBS 109.77 TaxID=1314802 RepID=A0A6A6XIL1_9PLEO|nr:chord-domain-containing protein [Melanomma pulvis-pyrius CBS 109.77]